jgi:short-subunit dehydrogenase
MFPVLEPDHVARETVRAIRRGKREHIFPFRLWLAVNGYRRTPLLSLWLLKRLGLFLPSRLAGGPRE